MRNFVPHKAALANHAVRKHGVKSFADVGGCWGVHAGYAIHVLAKNTIEKAYVADGKVDKQSRAAGRPTRSSSSSRASSTSPPSSSPFRRWMR